MSRRYFGEGAIFHGILVDEKDPNKEKQTFVKTVKDQAFEVQMAMMLSESCELPGLHHRNRFLLLTCA